MLVRTVKCLEGEVEIELICEPAFDYGRTPAEWTLVEGSRHTADATGAGQTIRLQTDLELGDRGQPRPRPAHPRSRRAGVRRARLGRGARRARRRRRRQPRGSTPRSRFWRRWLGRARPFPDHRWREAIQRSALTIKGLTYMPTGATVAALTTSLPETPGRRAQLGLPLHLDARLDVHAPGAAPARAGLGGRRVHAVRRRPRAQRATAACRSCTGSTGAAT